MSVGREAEPDVSYEALERKQIRRRLVRVEKAVQSHPSDKDYMLDESTLLDLAKMADVVGLEMTIQFKQVADDTASRN